MDKLGLVKTLQDFPDFRPQFFEVAQRGHRCVHINGWNQVDEPVSAVAVKSQKVTEKKYFQSVSYLDSSLTNLLEKHKNVASVVPTRIKQ